MALLYGKNQNIQAAVVASGIYYNKDTVTITFPRTFVSGDVIGWTIDGTLITTTYATSSNATLDAVLADFVAITGSVSSGKVVRYTDKPQITIQGKQVGHELVFTLPTSTADLQASTVIDHSGVEEFGLLITSPFDVLTNTIVDTAGGGVVYTGYSQPGSLPAQAVWAIKRVTTAGAIVTTVWASGVTNASFVWDSRAAYSYS